MSELQQRETWSTRSAFILAAIGSAVGLGNLWGFPYKLYSNGGGAFLIPYFIAMVLLGIPLLIMEFSAGHWAQLSAPGAFARIAGRYRFVGWWLVALAFVIITYYTVVLGYCVIYTVESLMGLLGSKLPWAGGTGAAQAHFFSEILGYKAGLALGAVKWKLLAGMLGSWLMIYLCLFRGVKWVSKVVLITVPLPWIMLIILTIRGLTLDGAVTGLQFYLEPDWSKLLEVDTWRWAFGQVFFSMSLGFAVMLSYASFLHRESDLNNNALIIGLGDLATSFVAGIAVFSTLGAMALVDNVAVDKVVAAGPGLAFVTFPYALSTLPTAPALFSLIFFIALLTLGIDSAFSIVEAVLASVDEARPQWARKYVLPGICITGAVIGVIYCCGGGGLNWLGMVDDLVNGPLGILVIALAESLVIGWSCKGEFLQTLRRHSNERSDWKLGYWWDVIVRYIAPAFLVILITWSVADFVAAKKISLLIGSGVFLLIPVLFSLFTSKETEPGHGHDVVGVTDDGTAMKLLLGLPLASIVIGVIIGLIKLGRTVPVQKAAETVAEPAGYVARELGMSAYVIMTVALMVIFGGLIWCFWKAMQAAGRSDQSLEEEANPPR